MDHISLYFQKFKGLKVKNELLKNALKEAVLSIAGVELAITDISVQGEKVFIKIIGPAKSEIILKKDKITEKVQEIVSNRQIDLK